jgi:predicted Zn-dependent protease
MDGNEREIVFEQAIADYRRGWFVSAQESLAHLVENGSRDPAHLSYYGLLLALTGNDKADSDSVELCQEAVVKNGRRSSLLYLNLARALSAAGRRREAIDALERGLLVHHSDRLLKRELQHLVPRGRPLFSSLSRKHPFNRYFGRARSLSGRMWMAIARPRRDV